MMNALQLRELPPDSPRNLRLIQAFLDRQGLRYEQMDYYIGLFDGENMLCGGGSAGHVIKGVAVDSALRGEGQMNRLLSHLYNRLRRMGAANVFVFTRPCNVEMFGDLGFHEVGGTKQAVLLESSPNGIGDYAEGLATYKGEGVNGCVVMNANPFTNGHLYLLKAAGKQCDTLHVFVVQTERSVFPYAVRKALVEQGTASLPNVMVHDGGPYIISAATFPTYFLKKDTDEAVVQAELDAAIFGRHIAPALGIAKRFVGEEPLDPMTEGYNGALARVLTPQGIQVRVLSRLMREGQVISASRVRALAAAGEWDTIGRMVPLPTYTYLKSYEAANILLKLKGSQERKG